MGNWPAMDWSGDGERLLAARVRSATDDELRAVVRAWRASDDSWRNAVFASDALAAIDFWSRFSGKEDSGRLIDIKRTLQLRLAPSDLEALGEYLSAMVDAIWIGADSTAIPDPWDAAGLEPLHSKLPATTRAAGKAPTTAGEPSTG